MILYLSIHCNIINIFFFQHPYINPPSFISCNSEGVITVRNFLPNGTLRDCLCKVIYCFLIINIPFSLKQYVLKSGENNYAVTKLKFCWFFFSITLITQFRFSCTCNIYILLNCNHLYVVSMGLSLRAQGSVIFPLQLAWTLQSSPH